MNTNQLVGKSFLRISRGRPQADVKLYRPAIQSVVGQALQRIADRIAGDSKLYTLLQKDYSLSLTTGEVSLSGLSPTLLLSKEARKKWRVIVDSNTFPLKSRPSISYRDNPDPTMDFYFYTVHRGRLVTWDSSGTPLTDPTATLTGNYVPLLTDAAFDNDVGELSDDLVDIVVGLVLESNNPAEVIRQAENMDAPDNQAQASNQQ